MTPPMYRKPKDIDIIANYVKDIKVFKDFQSNEEQMYELCKNLTLKSLAENKVLFEQGDKGDSYFIILEGNVEIFVKVGDEKTGMDTRKKVAILKKGDAFGDLSLLYGAPRNATVITKDPCDFIVMTKAIYDKVVKNY
jgi:CRP-like cAMP-binding protein